MTELQELMLAESTLWFT